MEITPKRAAYLKAEFECFVRIGLDEQARRQTMAEIEEYFAAGGRRPLPHFRYEFSYPEESEVTYIVDFEPDVRQLARLWEFLNKWSIEEVREMTSLL